jgi:hypothetical protein
VITDVPIWFAEETGAHTLALPDESPESVLDLARRFPGTSLIILAGDNGGIWPEIAATDPIGLACFAPVELPGSDPALAGFAVFRITCP